MKLFKVGTFTKASKGKSVIYAEHGDEILEKAKNGELTSRNGYMIEWDDDCVRATELEKWRRKGDDLCDGVVRCLGIGPGHDGLQMLLDYLDRTPEQARDPRVTAFWDEVSRPPPPAISGFASVSGEKGEVPLAEATPVTSLNRLTRYPPRTVAGGQAVFWRYSPEIFTALMHFSLAGGFSASRVVSVLRETNYLTGNNRDATWRRLLETSQFIIDAMNDLTPLTGQGWKSAIRVRMLHSQVRLRILDMKGLLKVYNIEVDGLPINQESVHLNLNADTQLTGFGRDLIATLGSFCIAPLWCIRRIGISLTPEEEAAYITVWRHIGFYLGVEPAHLVRYYSVDDGTPASIAVSRPSKLFACTATHLFSSPQAPEDPYSTTTYRVLSAVADRAPFKSGVLYCCEMSRFLLGEQLAERLSLPRGGWVNCLKVQRTCLGMGVFVYFGRYYRRGWEMERVVLCRKLMTMIVAWQLGERRTRFTAKATPTATADMLDDDPDHDALDPAVPMGPAAGKVVIRRWRWLVAEMVAVCAGAAVVGVLAVASVSKRYF